MIKCQYFEVEKQMNGEPITVKGCILIKGITPILVTHCLDVVAVTSLTTKIANGDQRLIMLYKDLEGVDDEISYKKFMYVIGKMVKKDSLPSSKYFDRQRVWEHLSNGIDNPDELNWEKAYDIQTVINEIIEETCPKIIMDMT